MNIHELSDLDADALTITTRGAHTWVTCTSEGEEVTVGPFPTQKLTSALPRHSDDMDGGVTAALIEKEVDRVDALAKLEALGDDGTALRCAVMIAQAGAGEATVAEFCEQIARGDDVNVAARAEQAEKERDEWRFRAGAAEPARDKWREIAKREQGTSDELARQLEATEASLREANGVVKSLRTAGPRPLTPEDITDEMVERARQVLRRYGIHGSTLPKIIYEMLTAALAPEPQRPDGAEEIEALIETSPWHIAGSCSAEADWLAEHGVRVTEDGVA